MTAWAHSLIRISNYEVETLQKRLAEITARRASAEMRIAVLEDDADQRAELGQMLCERLALPDVHVAATLFESGEALRRALQTDTFDLLAGPLLVV